MTTALRTLIALGLAFVACAAQAGQWQVAPLRTELSARRPTSALTVSNRADQPATLHVRAYVWTQENGEDRLEDTEALIVSPPIFTVHAGRAQTLRIGLRDPDADTTGERERAYRIVIEEVPNDSPDATGVRMILRMSLPIFVRPAQAPAQAQMDWRVVRNERGWQLEAANRGQAHAQLVNVRMNAPDRDEPIAAIESPTYVLPGAAKRWDLAPNPALVPGSPLRIEARTLTDRFDASVMPAP
ncbi:MAG TPA: fimbria/pilus periplasmic chaperone [Burkholderiaceae bacterium]|nr:fimbria/pilus periplasmic chaperone [Burkholderiaceae bacterium]